MKRIEKRWSLMRCYIKINIVALHVLHDAGCMTWISMESCATPNIHEQNLLVLLNAVSFADKIIFGRINYRKKVSSYRGHKAFYNEKVAKVIRFYEKHNIQYHIKYKTITEDRGGCCGIITRLNPTD